MADRRKDDMAAALEAMMQGQADATPDPDQDAEESLDAADDSAVTPPAPQVDPAIPAPPPVVMKSPAAVARPSRPTASSTSRPLTPTADAVRGVLRPPEPVPSLLSAKSLEFRRTIIPPMLTGGLLLALLGILPFVTAADSAFAAMKQRAPVAIFFIFVGVLLLVVAAFHMKAVRQQLAARRSATPADADSTA